MIKLRNLLVILFCTQFSFGQNIKLDCENGTQAEMNFCAKIAFEKADIELNKTYKSIIDQLNKDIQTNIKDSSLSLYNKTLKIKLIASQKNWIKLRDANATMEAYIYDGGSMSPMIFYKSKLNDTQIRIKYLKDFKEELFTN